MYTKVMRYREPENERERAREREREREREGMRERPWSCTISCAHSLKSSYTWKGQDRETHRNVSECQARI